MDENEVKRHMKAAIGQDSHRFEESPGKPLILGGVVFPGEPGLLANSDGDVVLHAITNAVSGITGQNILGKIADEMCRSGITDSAEYLRKALEFMQGRVSHVSLSMECLRPKISPMIPEMREHIAGLLGVEPSAIGITATTGEGLTDCGKGLGISVLCILTAED
jgi:ygbB family